MTQHVLPTGAILSFRPRREYFKWAAEWEAATGRILAAHERTREAGLAKLAEVDSWMEDYKGMCEDGRAEVGEAKKGNVAKGTS